MEAIDDGNIERVIQLDAKLQDTDESLPELLEEFAAALENDDQAKAETVLRSYSQRIEQTRIDEQESAKRVATARNNQISSRSGLQDLHSSITSRFLQNSVRITFLFRAGAYFEEPNVVSKTDIIATARDTKSIEQDVDRIAERASAATEDITIPVALEIVPDGPVEFTVDGQMSATITVLNAGDRDAQNVTTTVSAGDNLNAELTPSTVGTLTGGERVATDVSLSATSVGRYQVTVAATAEDTERVVGNIPVTVSESSNSELSSRFDNGDGKIDRDELFDAISAFQNGNLDRSVLFDIIAEFQTEDPRWADVDQ